jgi:hypothetical protein
VLLYQTLLGVYAFILDLKAPYSSGAEIASFLNSQPKAGPVLIGVEGTDTKLAWRNDLAEPVAVYLPSWRMGSPQAIAANPSLSAFYNKPPDFRSCSIALNELNFYFTSRSLQTVALTSESADVFKCFTESGMFTTVASLTAQEGFDFGEDLSAVILAREAPRAQR